MKKLVNIILYPFMLFAAGGFALSMIVHALALAGVAVPGGKAVWDLSTGIFIVWIPTVLVSARIPMHARREFWKIALSGCPPWMRIALYALFVYAGINFIIFMYSAKTPQAAGGNDLPIIRGFSGHWMVFYGTAFAVLYSAIRSPRFFFPRKRCPNGHKAGPTAHFCPRCGYAFPAEPGNV